MSTELIELPPSEDSSGAATTESQAKKVSEAEMLEVSIHDFSYYWECLRPLTQDAGGSEKEVAGATAAENGGEEMTGEGVDSGQEVQGGGEGEGNGNQEAVPEKLQDEDEMRDPLYKRVFFSVFPQLRRGVCVILVTKCKNELYA